LRQHGWRDVPVMVQVHDDVQVHLLQDLHLIDQGALPELHVDLDLAVDLDADATERAIQREHERPDPRRRDQPAKPDLHPLSPAQA
jgi:hypothetical protein